MKKKIFITGGAGYCGSKLVPDLLKKGYLVTIYDILYFGVSFLPKHSNLKIIQGDIRDNKKILPYYKWADVVIWTAALVGDGACSINPENTIDVNVKTVNFLEKNFNKKIIFFSTCSVYGAREGILDETSPTNPLSVYAHSKLQAEKILSKKNCLIFRLGTLFGIGDFFSRIRMDLVVNTLVAKAIYKKEITIFGGEQYRPLLHVKDVARAVELAIRSKKKGIYNLHNKNLIIYQIAEKIKKTFKKLKINKISMKFEDLRNYRVSSKKAIKELKFKPKYDLRYGIEEMKKLLNQNRIKDIDNPKYINQAYLKKFNKES